MSQSATRFSASACRIFFIVGDQAFQLFSFSQNPNDGSIYFSAPNFADIDWLMPSLGNAHTPILLSYKLGGAGKLSLHGSGVAHVRPYDSPRRNEFIICGNPLTASDGQTLGVRHLLTLFLPEPRHCPDSPAMARRGDCIIQSKQLHPYVIVFWAVPASRPLTVTVSGSFHVDDLEEVPPNGGWGAFNLKLHTVVWFAYRTKHMARWPSNAQACYLDGNLVPLIIGTGEGKFRLELRRPTYTLSDTQLTIAI
jgi:hypothetical protein